MLFRSSLKLSQLFASASIRNKCCHSPFVTDEGYHIIDLSCQLDPEDLTQLDQILQSEEAVIETGIFIDFATDLWVGEKDHSITKKAF